MKAHHRVIKNTGILYARMAITVFLSLYTTRLVLGALGVDDFGIFSVVGGAIAMLTFLNASMSAATQRFMSFAQGQGDECRQRSIFNVSVVLHAVIAVVLLAILEGAGFILFNGILKIAPERMHAAWVVYQFAIASTFFTVISVPYSAVINAHENMLLFSVLGVIEAALKLGIAFYIASADNDRLVDYGFLMAALSLVLMVLRAAYCHVRYQECVLAPKRNFSRPLFKEMSNFAGWSFLGSSTSMVANYGQGVVLNMFFGTAVNAAQSVAGQVSGQLGAFASTMLRALNPLIDKSEGAGNRDLMLKASMMGSKMGFFLLMLFYVPVLLEMPYIFGLWLKAVPEYTVIFCSLLLVHNLIEQLFITLASSISAVGNIKGYQIVTSILTLFPLAASFLLLQAGFAPYVSYIVFLAYAVIMLAVVMYFATRLCELPISIYLRNVVFRCVASFILTLVISALPLIMMERSMNQLLLVCGLSFSTCLVIIWGLGFCENERNIVKAISVSIIKQCLTSIGKVDH